MREGGGMMRGRREKGLGVVQVLARGRRHKTMQTKDLCMRVEGYDCRSSNFVRTYCMYVGWQGAGMCNCGSAHDFFPFSAGGSLSCSLSHVL